MQPERIISFVLIMIFLAACNSGQSTMAEGTFPGSQAEKEIAEISFNEYEYDFGRITEGEMVAHIFTFTNKGPGNLVISSASTSCGCTVPKYDRKPIPPGGGGSLEVVFDSRGRSGIQTKTVSVRTNSVTEVVILKISAEVMSGKR